MIRAASIAAVLLLVALPAEAQRMASYEGRKSAQTGAQKLYELLPTACPRLGQSMRDIIDYSLHVGFPDDDGIYGEAARSYEATEIVMVTLRANILPKAIPKAVTAANHWANITVVATAGGPTVIVLTDPLGYWLCNKSPEPGHDLVLIAAPQLTAAMGR